MDGSLPLRARKKQRTRDAIIQAAVRLFTEKGFENTSVEEIAAAAEVAPRTFYRYFPTKVDVAFFDPNEDEARERCLLERRPGESDMNRVLRTMRSLVTASSRNLDSYGKMYALVRSAPALQARMLEDLRRSEKVMAERLLAGKARRPEAEFRARILAACVTAVTHAVFSSWLESGRRSSASLSKDLERAVELMRSGFDPEGPRLEVRAAAAERARPSGDGA